MGYVLFKDIAYCTNAHNGLETYKLEKSQARGHLVGYAYLGTAGGTHARSPTT